MTTQHRQLVTICQQRLAQVLPDQTCSACDQDPHDNLQQRF
jgi:hypothetical protein